MTRKKRWGPDLYVIYSESEEGYWSNEWGWTGLEEATVFTAEETKRLNLPMSANNDAEWLKMPKIK